MKYKIDKIRERTVTEEGKEREIIRVWYSCPGLDYRGKMEFEKAGFHADKAKKAIEKELEELKKLKEL